MRRALVIGSAGQDGQILFQQLADEGMAVAGIERGGMRIHGDIAIPRADILDKASISAAIQSLAPHEVYYLAAVHHASQEAAGDAFDLLQRSFAVHVTGLLHVLEAIRLHAPQARLFYAASSHVFGQPTEPVQNEQTPFAPTCPYGITKTAGAHLCRYYRAEHGIAASVGILYNHESPLRQSHFVSQKIVRAARAIARGEQDSLVLGSLDAQVDWGYAPDYVDAMVRIVRDAEPSDYVIATGEVHSVREFVEHAFGALGLDWRQHVGVDPALLRKPRRTLIGDATKLHRATGWRPSIGFAKMVQRLVADDTAAP